ncbi:FAD-dependent oxidoreductase [Kibdelosporangium aridum]|uniref:FAD-dependent oxidoreductase n=1 Tax=Kibdelosporangium aridum TaxID=2030 RepID=UPI0035EFD9FC
MDRIDVLVVGSGFGGSVAALRLAEKGYRVTVLEAGRRFADTDLASGPWQLHRVLWAPRIGLRGIIRVRVRRRLIVLTGIGVGGGSLAYAGVHYRPDPEVFQAAGWDRSVDWSSELDPWFARAEQMLGTTTVPDLSPGDQALRRTANALGAVETFHPTRVGIDFSSCTLCGHCTTGCRTGAKNTLAKNYLRLAGQVGARVLPLTEVTKLRPRSDGWDVYARDRVWRATHVVLAAGAWGTTELLHRSALPGLSPALGTRMCTNGERLYVTRAKVGDGVAISSAFRPDAATTVQLCRIGPGRIAFLNAMARDDHLVSHYGRVTVKFMEQIGSRAWAALPVTGHPLGGCPLGTNPATSVADLRHRAHGYPTLHIADGSTIPHNLGVNPALTITAMAERAFAMWEDA